MIPRIIIRQTEFRLRIPEEFTSRFQESVLGNWVTRWRRKKGLSLVGEANQGIAVQASEIEAVSIETWSAGWRVNFGGIERG